MRENLVGKEGEEEIHQQFDTATSLNFITSYEDVIPVGEKPGNMMKTLKKVLSGNPLWPEAAIIGELGIIVGITERFTDDDIEALGGDNFWATTCYDLLTKIATKDSRVQSNWGKLLSSQKYDPSYPLPWVLAIMSCLISGDAPFNHGCLGKPASLKMLGGRLAKLELGFKALCIDLPATITSPALPANTTLSLSLRSLMSNKGLPLSDIDLIREGLEKGNGNLSALDGRAWQILGEATVSDVLTISPYEQLALQLSTRVASITGVVLTQYESKLILTGKLSKILLNKMSSCERSNNMAFSNVFNIFQTLETANSVAGKMLYPDAYDCAAELGAHISLSANISGVTIDWTAIIEYVIFPHLLHFAQERFLALQTNIKEVKSLRVLPSWLQLRIGPLLAKTKIFKDATIEKRGTGICFNFQKGTCTRGDKCRYRHEVEVAKRPKIVCRDFQNGVCKRGEKCNYVHEAKEAV
jgi:hypothetical protein